MYDNAGKDKQAIYLKGIIQAFGVVRADIPLVRIGSTMEPKPEYRMFYDAINVEIAKAESMLSKLT